MKKVLVCCMAFIAFIFVGCANISQALDNASIDNNWDRLLGLEFDILAPNGKLNADNYKEHWELVKKAEPVRKWQKDMLDGNKDFLEAKLKLTLEFLRSINLSYKNDKIGGIKTETFKEYEKNIGNFYKIDPNWVTNNDIRVMREEIEEYANQIEKFPALLPSYSWLYRKGNDSYVFWINLTSEKDVQDNIKLIEKSLKKLDILFTRNYNGDFKID